MKYQLLIKGKNVIIKFFLHLELLDVVFILLINVKRPIIVGILTFKSITNFMLI